ncbi:MAG: hypothetical protein JW714_03220 [Candidatus Omnitrophica bacterium]|nr:hypothetical protein [Candidatus Omnitrophota bacterium]
MTITCLQEIIKRHAIHLQEKIANQLTFPKVILEINNGGSLEDEKTLKAVESLDEVLPIIDTEFRNLIEELNSQPK